MELTLTWVILIFALGLLLFRDTSLRVAMAVGLVLGSLLAGGWLGAVGHTLDRAFNSLT